MSLIPCKYFARNECRFGDSCRFYHARGGNQNVVGASVFNRPLGGSNFNSAQHQQDVLNLTAKSQQNMDTMVELVKKDMAEWDFGKIWPFSSYGPVGGKPSVPGFDDLSVEELRYRYLQNNKMPPDLSNEMRSVQQARMNYQQMTPATRNILERIILKGERISSNNMATPTAPTWGTSTATPAAASIFGGSGNAFGSGLSSTLVSQPASMQNLPNTFGGSGSVFGGLSAPPNQTWGQQGGGGMDSMEGSQIQQTPSLFGQSQQQSTNVGLFSTNPSKPTSLFGNISVASPLQQQQQPSIFGGQPNQTFTQPQQQQSLGLFQSQSSPIVQPSLQSPNAFQGVAQTLPQQVLSIGSQIPSSSSIFGGSNLMASSGQIPQTPGIFGGNLSATIAPNSSISSSPGIFGGGNNPVSSTPSLFGDKSFASNIPSQPSLFGAPPNANSTSLFGQPPQQQQKQPTGLFTSSGSSISGIIPTDQKFVYSEESDLTPEELEAFRADNFTIENIPIRPPPRSCCGL